MKIAVTSTIILSIPDEHFDDDTYDDVVSAARFSAINTLAALPLAKLDAEPNVEAELLE